MNTSNNLRLWRSAVLLGSLIGVTSQTVHGQEPYTKDAITKAWASREQKVKNAKFRYEGKKTVTKGSLSWILSVPGKTATPIAKDAVVPPTDSTFPVSATVSFDMSRLRFTLNTQHWSWEKNCYSPATTTTSFDGKTSKVLDDAWADCAWPIGQIRKEPTNIYAGLSQLRPILMTFRPLVANMRAYDLADFELTKREARIGDTECLELHRITDDGRQRRLWVDPARDFVIVRFLESRGDVVQLKIDVRYTSHPTIRWIPKEWDLYDHELTNGGLESFATLRVVQSVVNDESDIDYGIDFPLGTRVVDEVESTNYIIRPDGSGKRMIPFSDVGATYERLLETEPGTALGPPPTGSVWKWLVVGAAVVVAIVCLTLRQRRVTTKVM